MEWVCRKKHDHCVQNIIDMGTESEKTGSSSLLIKVLIWIEPHTLIFKTKPQTFIILIIL